VTADITGWAVMSSISVCKKNGAVCSDLATEDDVICLVTDGAVGVREKPRPHNLSGRPPMGKIRWSQKFFDREKDQKPSGNPLLRSVQ